MVDAVSVDAVVVGGRCAGAATAMLLARQGHRVLVVDQDAFPSDMKLSTHLVWHAGVDLLQSWGLLEPLRRAGTPLLTRFSLDLGELVLSGNPPHTQAHAAIAPRRIVLDQVLRDAAARAGAQLLDNTSFQDVMRDAAGVVTGIQCKQADGTPLTVHARCVIGADGRGSRVARAVGSPSTHEFTREQCSVNVFAYFSGVPMNGVEFYSRPERMGYAWQTNDGLVMSGVILPGREERTEREGLEPLILDELSSMAPDLAARLKAGRRETDWLRVAIATGARQASGPGWALVGDAGITFDPITAAGITNALRDAEHLSQALHRAFKDDAPLGQTLADYARQRDETAVPWHLFAQQMAELLPPPPELVALLGAMAGNQPQIDRYFGLFGQTVSPTDFFSHENMHKIMEDAQARA